MAIASLMARMAAPYAVIDRMREPNAVAAITAIVKKEEIGVLVVGLPRGMSGQETEQTAKTREFARELEAALGSIPVVMQDEAGTSIEAEARLRARGKPYGKGEIDSEAATIILSDYLQQVAGSAA